MGINRASAPVLFVSAVLALNSLALIVISALFVWETATSPSESLGGAIFLDALIVLSAVATILVLVMFWQGKPASRSAIIVLQMIVVGIGIASAQGVEPRWDIALALIVPAALVTIFMLWNSNVARHLTLRA